MMRDDIWTDDEDTPRRPRSITTVIAIAAIPWLIVAGLIFLPRAGGDPGSADPYAGTDGRAMVDPPPGDTGTPEPQPDPGAGPAHGEVPDDATGPEASSDRPDPSSTAPTPPTVDGLAPSDGDGVPTDQAERELGALATVVARAWATGVAPPLTVEGLPPATEARYAEHVVVESVERPAPRLAVVTLLVVMLEETADDLRADIRRLAVPLATNGGQPHPAGVPWWLPAPALTTLELAGDPYEDPSLHAEAAEALERAGYRDVLVEELRRTSTGVWMAAISGLDPSGHATDSTPWLVHDGHRFDVLGESQGETAGETPPAIGGGVDGDDPEVVP